MSECPNCGTTKDSLNSLRIYGKFTCKDGTCPFKSEVQAQAVQQAVSIVAERLQEQDTRAQEAEVAPPAEESPQQQTAPAPVSLPAESRLFVPETDTNYVLPKGIAAKMDRVHAISLKHPVNVMLLGPQGSGKTSMARQYAAKYGLPIYVAPCVTMQEPQEWWGARHFDPDRGDYYTESLFLEAIETPRAVVVLDDMNRVENPKVLNPLFPLLDDRRTSWIEERRGFVRVAPGVVFFATLNEGWEFQGTDPIDLALRDRFYQIKMAYPPIETMTTVIVAKTGLDRVSAGQLSRFAVTLYENPKTPLQVSMRQNLLIAEDIVAGASFRDAVYYSIIPGLGGDQQESCLQALQMVLGEADLQAASAAPTEWASW